LLKTVDGVPRDRPLIVQLGGADEAALVAAAREIEATHGHVIDAIDLNLGCPQSCARRGSYGAFVSAQDAERLVRALDDALVTLPVTCKVRAQPTDASIDDPNGVISCEATVALAIRLANAGATMVCVHGRTRAQKGNGAADWQVVRAVAQALANNPVGRDGLGVPVIGNGNIRHKRDALALLDYAGCAAVMSAEALLAVPRLFADDSEALSRFPFRFRRDAACDVALEYVALTLDRSTPRPPVAWARAHVLAIVHRMLPLHPLIGASIDKAASLADLQRAVDSLRHAANPHTTQAQTDPHIDVPDESDNAAGNESVSDCESWWCAPPERRADRRPCVTDPAADAAASRRAERGRRERRSLKLARLRAARSERSDVRPPSERALEAVGMHNLKLCRGGCGNPGKHACENCACRSCCARMRGAGGDCGQHAHKKAKLVVC
jgi:tRNA-dihydrouridine synthase